MIGRGGIIVVWESNKLIKKSKRILVLIFGLFHQYNAKQMKEENLLGQKLDFCVAFNGSTLKISLEFYYPMYFVYIQL